MRYEPKSGDLKTVEELLALEELPVGDAKDLIYGGVDYAYGEIFYGHSGCGWIVGSRGICMCFDDEIEELDF